MTFLPGVQITVEKMNPSILPVIGYTLETNSSSRTAIDMRQIAINTVKPFLSQVEGVSEVRIIGGKQKEYWLTLDPQRMSTLGITPDISFQCTDPNKFYSIQRLCVRLSASYILLLQMLLFIRLMNWKIL